MPSHATLPAINIQKTLAKAQKAQRSGKYAEAATTYLEVLSRFPRNPRARKAVSEVSPQATAELVQKAKTCETARNLNDAERFWQVAAQLYPDDIFIGLSLARCRSGLGRHHAALVAANAVLKQHPDDPTALNTKGNILRDLDRPDEAEQAYRAAMAHVADPSGSLNNLGILAKARGDAREAASLFRQALSSSPENASLHFNLSGCQTYRPGDAHIEQMRHVLSRADQNDPDIAPLHFALFKALDDVDDREAAFRHLVAGNRLCKSVSGFDISREAHRFAWLKSLASNQEIPSKKGSATPTRPVFIVGLPRSGTTLIERCLARVNGVRAGGELSFVSNAVAPLLRQLQAGNKAGPSASDLLSLRVVLQEQIAEHAAGVPVLIDKMPLNFRWAALICAALPEARIIWVKRDPMPVAWSLFRHLFSSPGNGFAYDMADIAAYSLLHRDLMQVWTQKFPGQIHTVDYQSVVTDTEKSLRNVIEHCGLSWTDKCLEPEAAGGQILTASNIQIQSGIYSGSDESWQRYAPQLAPLHKAMRAVAMV